MKIFHNLMALTISCIAFFATSCSSNMDILDYEENFNNSLVLSSTITSEDFDRMQEDYIQKAYFTSQETRGEEVFTTAEESREFIQPFINDGEALINQLLTKNDLMLTEEDKEFFESLEDEELALLSLVVLQSACVDECEDITFNEGSSLTRASIDTAKLRSCLAFALGVSQIKELAVTKVITAATLRSAIMAIGKRYLGYIGVALMVFDFYDCFYK